MKKCPKYVGIQCVNGGCPIALREEYEERGIPVPKSCKDCYEYKGCQDCGLAGTEHCTAEEQKKYKA